MVQLGFQHSRNCISQSRYFSRMNFNIRAHCDFVFYNFYCALFEDTIDIEVTIQSVDDIHTYRRDRTTQAASYSHWSRQMKPYPSIRKKISKYEELKKRNFNSFTPVRENNFDKKISRRFQKSRKYRKLDMGCFMPSTVASTWPTTTTTSISVNLSVPSDPPSTLSVPTVPKQPTPSQPSKIWAKPYSTPVPLSSPVHSDWSSEEDWD